MQCPRCRGQLIVRNGKGRKFWGCSSYPDCTYTQEYVDIGRPYEVERGLGRFLDRQNKGLKELKERLKRK